MALDLDTPTLPVVGGSAGAWGTILNAAIDALVAELEGEVPAITDVLGLTTGGEITGEIEVRRDLYTAVDLGAAVSGSVNLDLSLGRHFHGTVVGATTFSFTNVPAAVTGGDAMIITVELEDGGANITWPAGTQWPGGSAPPLTDPGLDVVTFLLRGGNIYAALGMLDLS